jgi:hypothetical protein
MTHHNMLLHLLSDNTATSHLYLYRGVKDLSGQALHLPAQKRSGVSFDKRVSLVLDKHH